MGPRNQWQVAWWRAALPRFPLAPEADPPAWEIFMPERFATEREALACAVAKIEAGYRSEITGPSGERLENRNILRRMHA
jgi:hypothetical protein